MVLVDTVYQRVLALANKEQRGYITPQEFNLLANQAQMAIFNQYIFDIKQAHEEHVNNTEYSNELDLLNEKLAPFEMLGVSTNITGGLAVLPTHDYLGSVKYVYLDIPTNAIKTIEIQENFLVY